MKVIMLKDLKGTGKVGDVVEAYQIVEIKRTL